MRETKFIIVGGGLAGALTACYLGKAGYTVEVYEMRGDLRTDAVGGGRSINLALSYRGLCALDPVGLQDEILKMAVPMRGRMIHHVIGEAREFSSIEDGVEQVYSIGAGSSCAFQPYGVDDSQAINSVSRSGLNAALLAAAERYSNVKLFFHHKCTDVDLDAAEVEFLVTSTGETKRVSGDVIVSADGAFSAVRKAMQRQDRFNYSQSYLQHGYKELHIPPGPGSSPERPVFQLEKNALHIWPRKSFMMIALPNADGSFTCTLFWPFQGENSFEAIRCEHDLLAFFRREFPDAVPLMPTLAEDYFGNPTASLVTIRCSPWHVGGRVVLLGDAAHAVVPFYGQGMNAAFEDVMVLDECIREAASAISPPTTEECSALGARGPSSRSGGGVTMMDSAKPPPASNDQWIADWQPAFERFESLRKPNADALADLAIGNFLEMRDKTGSRLFLLKKRGEKLLAKILPGWYLPLYGMVTFSRIPYAEAVARDKRQKRVLGILACALAVLLIILLAVATF